MLFDCCLCIFLFCVCTDNGTPGCQDDGPRHIMRLASFGETLSHLGSLLLFACSQKNAA